jgi:hypothetical protein
LPKYMNRRCNPVFRGLINLQGSLIVQQIAN